MKCLAPMLTNIQAIIPKIAHISIARSMNMEKFLTKMPRASASPITTSVSLTKLSPCGKKAKTQRRQSASSIAIRCSVTTMPNNGESGIINIRANSSLQRAEAGCGQSMISIRRLQAMTTAFSNSTNSMKATSLLSKRKQPKKSLLPYHPLSALWAKTRNSSSA